MPIIVTLVSSLGEWLVWRNNVLQRVLSFDNSIKGVVGGRYTPCVGIGGGAAPFGDAVEKIGPMVRSFLLNIKMSENLTVTAAGAFGPDSYLKHVKCSSATA